MISFNIEFVQPPRSGINGCVCYVNVSDFNITDSFVSFTTNGEQVFIPARNVISIDVVEPKPLKQATNKMINDLLDKASEDLKEDQTKRFEVMPFCTEN